MIATNRAVFETAKAATLALEELGSTEQLTCEARSLCFTLKAVAEYAFEKEASSAIYTLAERIEALIGELDESASRASATLHPIVYPNKGDVQ